MPIAYLWFQECHGEVPLRSVQSLSCQPHRIQPSCRLHQPPIEKRELTICIDPGNKPLYVTSTVRAFALTIRTLNLGKCPPLSVILLQQFTDHRSPELLRWLVA
jgi:hypothetical protein